MLKALYVLLKREDALKKGKHGLVERIDGLKIEPFGTQRR